LYGPQWWNGAAANFGDPPEHGRVKISGPAVITHAHWNVFQDNETPFVPNRFPIQATLTNYSCAMFT
jgi:hypothetical protein